MPAESTDEPVPGEEIAQQIERIVGSRIFAKSERMRALLDYLLEQTLHGTPESLKEYAIGVDVFKKDATFDPRVHNGSNRGSALAKQAR